MLHSYKPGLRLPGGGVKTGEDHSAAAVRELREETGVVIPQAHLRFFLAYRGRYGVRSIFETRLAHEPMLRVDQREIVYAGFNAPEEVTEYTRAVKGYLCQSVDQRRRFAATRLATTDHRSLAGNEANQKTMAPVPTETDPASRASTIQRTPALP